MKVCDIMRPALTIDSKQKVSSAAALMSQKKVHSLIVTSNSKIAGMISEDEIMENLDKLSSKISDIMIKDVKTIDDSEELGEVAEIMNREGVRRLPVIKGEKLVGMITATDLIAHSGELSEIFLFD